MFVASSSSGEICLMAGCCKTQEHWLVVCDFRAYGDMYDSTICRLPADNRDDGWIQEKAFGWDCQILQGTRIFQHRLISWKCQAWHVYSTRKKTKRQKTTSRVERVMRTVNMRTNVSKWSKAGALNVTKVRLPIIITVLMRNRSKPFQYGTSAELVGKKTWQLKKKRLST